MPSDSDLMERVVDGHLRASFAINKTCEEEPSKPL